jgi:hypothetical protein
VAKEKPWRGKLLSNFIPHPRVNSQLKSSPFGREKNQFPWVKSMGNLCYILSDLGAHKGASGENIQMMMINRIGICS